MVINELKFELEDKKNIQAYARRMNDEIKDGEIGYYHLPNLSEDLSQNLKRLKNDDFQNIVLVGVGGSSLGVKALSDMLNPSKNLIFIDNLDPFLVENSLKNIKFNQTKFIISSKSGTTIETISIFKYLLAKFNPPNLNNFIFITDPNSPLEKYAKENNATVFNLPKNVGGRFSVLSAIGVVPLYLAGIDINELLRGARNCSEHYLSGSDDTILQKAYHYATHIHAKINVVFSYSARLASFNDWFVQLWAESLGKKRGFKRVGLTPIGLIGSKDQHSFLQLIMEGVKDKTISFITVKDHNLNAKIPQISLKGIEKTDFVGGFDMGEILNTQAKATAQALMSENLSVDFITLDKLDEWHAGWLVYYFELLTSATGLMLGINTYDQPGVELGKRLLRQMIENQNR